MALEEQRGCETPASAPTAIMTGFFNHRYLHERMGEEVVQAQRKQPLSVMMLDLDDFQARQRHVRPSVRRPRTGGWAAELIRATLRASDVPARYGGDEFTVFRHPGTDSEEATHAVHPRRLPRPAVRGGAARAGADRRVNRHRHVPDRRPDGDRADRERRPRPVSGQARRPGRPGRREQDGKYYPRLAIGTWRPGWTAAVRGRILYSRREPIPRRARSMDRVGPRIRRSWWTFFGAFLLLSALVLVGAVAPDASVADRALLVVVIVAGAAAIVHGSAVGELDARRRGEAESFARIAGGLSRSVSPDAIVDAIAEELGGATGADHVVVVRREVRSLAGGPPRQPQPRHPDPFDAAGGRRPGGRHPRPPGAPARDRRPDRASGAQRLRARAGDGGAPIRGRDRRRRDRGLTPRGRDVAGVDAADAEWRRRRGIRGALAGGVAPGCRGAGCHRFADRPSQPALFRRVRRVAGARSTRRRRRRDRWSTSTSSRR